MLRWMTDSSTGFVVLLMVAFTLMLGVYVLPVLLAWVMASPHRVAITMLDLLLGWTIIGWLAALIWALTSGREGSFDEEEPARKEPWIS